MNRGAGTYGGDFPAVVSTRVRSQPRRSADER